MLLIFKISYVYIGLGSYVYINSLKQNSSDISMSIWTE